MPAIHGRIGGWLLSLMPLPNGSPWLPVVVVDAALLWQPCCASRFPSDDVYHFHSVCKPKKLFSFSLVLYFCCMISSWFPTLCFIPVVAGNPEVKQQQDSKTINLPAGGAPLLVGCWNLRLSQRRWADDKRVQCQDDPIRHLMHMGFVVPRVLNWNYVGRGVVRWILPFKDSRKCRNLIE